MKSNNIIEGKRLSNTKKVPRGKKKGLSPKPLKNKNYDTETD